MLDVQRQTYTVKEAAKILGVGIVSAYEAIKNVEIPHIKVGRRIIIPKVALDNMLREVI